ncbi:MAG: tetratricopeptide repeat protein [Rhodospirillales bacterium]|nr:tetratricopeptide repeat protein [Rhodospirillales bacterium]
MATKELPQNDLIHEIEESLRQEKLETLWKEYGSYLIAGIILTILFTAAITSWRSWNTKVNEAATASIMEALEADDPVRALTDASKSLRAGHGALATLTAAGILMQDGKNEEALVQLENTANNKKLDAQWRDLANVLMVRLSWGIQTEATDTDALLARLSPITSNNKNIWQPEALLQSALIEAHDRENYTQARAYLTQIIENNEAPAALKTKATMLDHVYEVKETAKETAQ